MEIWKKCVRSPLKWLAEAKWWSTMGFDVCPSFWKTYFVWESYRASQKNIRSPQYKAERSSEPFAFFWVAVHVKCCFRSCLKVCLGCIEWSQFLADYVDLIIPTLNHNRQYWNVASNPHWNSPLTHIINSGCILGLGIITHFFNWINLGLWLDHDAFCTDRGLPGWFRNMRSFRYCLASVLEAQFFTTLSNNSP